MISNLAKIQKLYYCQHGNKNSHCSNIATHQVRLRSKKDKSIIVMKSEWQYRCDNHKNTGTKTKRVYQIDDLDQSYTLKKINDFLISLIGKRIKSNAHTARELEVKYLKSNGGVMCYQSHSKKWKFVYYEQIQEILTPAKQ